MRGAQLRGRGPRAAGSGRARSCPGDSRSRRGRCVGSSPTACSVRVRSSASADDGAGLLVLGDEAPGEPGTPLLAALGLEPDVVFDITVEGNRPDALSMAGIARDLAGRLRLRSRSPSRPSAAERPPRRVDGVTTSVDALDLCPRLTVTVFGDVVIGPSPRWIARRLLLAGMRPINNVVDASDYVMLELGQPTHPYDLARLPGRGLTVRRARPGETVETLDGEVANGRRARAQLGQQGEDCLICDAEGTPVGIGGIMGGASSEIVERARRRCSSRPPTSRRWRSPAPPNASGCGPRRPHRFDRGCDPWGDRAVGPVVSASSWPRACRACGRPTACSTCGATCRSPSSSRSR